MPDLWRDSPSQHGTKGMRKKQSAKKKEDDLAARIEKLRAECERTIDEEAEKQRPRDQRSSIPAQTMRAMWLARGGNVFDAALLASRGK